ncbi:MAG: hypothetical protein C0606_11165 [Hyphomicrobiales bacterium]|nr:MAG: hypothetical protein C0606_11165 [Hyphomicrobiales bacterium]
MGTEENPYTPKPSTISYLDPKTGKKCRKLNEGAEDIVSSICNAVGERNIPANLDYVALWDALDGLEIRQTLLEKTGNTSYYRRQYKSIETITKKAEGLMEALRRDDAIDAVEVLSECLPPFSGFQWPKTIGSEPLPTDDDGRPSSDELAHRTRVRPSGEPDICASMTELITALDRLVDYGNERLKQIDREGWTKTPLLDADGSSTREMVWHLARIYEKHFERDAGTSTVVDGSEERGGPFVRFIQRVFKAFELTQSRDFPAGETVRKALLNRPART